MRLSVGLLVMTVVARHLGPEGFAAYSYLLSVTAILLPIARYSCDGIVLRDIAARPQQAGIIVTTSFAMTMFFALLAVLVGILVFRLVPGPAVISDILIALALVMVIVVPAEVFLAAIKAQERMALVAIPRAAIVILAGAATLVLALSGAGLTAFVAMRGIEAVALALAAYLAFIALGVRAVRPALSREYGVEFLKAGLPLTLSGFAAMVFLRADQVMLGAMGEPGELGHYGVAVRVAEVANFLPTVLQASLYPALVRNHAQGIDAFRRFMQRTFDSFALAAWPAMIGTALAGWLLIVPVFGSEYGASVPLFLLLVAASPFFFLYIALGSMLMVEGRVWTFAAISLASAGINLVANMLAIPLWGAAGAAGTTILTYFASSIGLSLVIPSTREAALQMLAAMSPVGAARRLHLHLRPVAGTITDERA